MHALPEHPYSLLFNHTVFMNLLVHPCGVSSFVRLCLEGPILSHSEGSLCFLPCTLYTETLAFPCTTASHACFIRLCTHRKTIFNDSVARRRKQHSILNRPTHFTQ